MFSANSHKLLKFPIILVTLGVLAFGFTCAGMTKHASMHNEADAALVMQMGNQQTCCSTSISGHVESWKGALLAVPREMRDRILLLVFWLAIVFAISCLRFQLDFESRLLSYKLYARDNPSFLLFNYLKLAFARGILNPKIY